MFFKFCSSLVLDLYCVRLALSLVLSSIMKSKEMNSGVGLFLYVPREMNLDRLS
jgi:hypothetical protein